MHAEVAGAFLYWLGLVAGGCGFGLPKIAIVAGVVVQELSCRGNDARMQMNKQSIVVVVSALQSRPDVV